jgi:hypothetical protein
VSIVDLKSDRLLTAAMSQRDRHMHICGPNIFPLLLGFTYEFYMFL